MRPDRRTGSPRRCACLPTKPPRCCVRSGRAAACATRWCLSLARHPQPDDRAKFVAALASPQPRSSSGPPRHWNSWASKHPAEMAAALRALKQACSLGKQSNRDARSCGCSSSGRKTAPTSSWDADPAKLWVGWYQLFADYYPAERPSSKRAPAPTWQRWQRRLAAIDWRAGDATAGRQVFELRTCHRCHQAKRALGPRAQGRRHADVARRSVYSDRRSEPRSFARLSTTLVATNSGQVYHGLVVYESPESTLLQTGPDTTVRITNTETDVGAAGHAIADAHRLARSAFGPGPERLCTPILKSLEAK